MYAPASNGHLLPRLCLGGSIGAAVQAYQMAPSEANGESKNVAEVDGSPSEDTASDGLPGFAEFFEMSTEESVMDVAEEERGPTDDISSDELPGTALVFQISTPRSSPETPRMPEMQSSAESLVDGATVFFRMCGSTDSDAESEVDAFDGFDSQPAGLQGDGQGPEALLAQAGAGGQRAHAVAPACPRPVGGFVDWLARSGAWHGALACLIAGVSVVQAPAP